MFLRFDRPCAWCEHAEATKLRSRKPICDECDSRFFTPADVQLVIDVAEFKDAVDEDGFPVGMYVSPEMRKRVRGVA